MTTNTRERLFDIIIKEMPPCNSSPFDKELYTEEIVSAILSANILQPDLTDKEIDLYGHQRALFELRNLFGLPDGESYYEIYEKHKDIVEGLKPDPDVLGDVVEALEEARNYLESVGFKGNRHVMRKAKQSLQRIKGENDQD